MPFLVKLETGVWLTKGQGDPPRTLDLKRAGEWSTRKGAEKALERARSYRRFDHASITFVA